MLFIAEISDERFKELLLSVRKHSGNKDSFMMNTSFNEIAHDFHTLLAKNVTKILQSSPYVTYDDKESLMTTALFYLYECANKNFVIPPKNIYKAFNEYVAKSIYHKLQDDVAEMKMGDAGEKISHGTMAKVVKVDKFVKDFQSKHDKYPNISEISKGTGFKEELVIRYLNTLKLHTPHHLEYQIKDNMSLEDLIPSSSKTPEELFLENEKSAIFQKAKENAFDIIQKETGRMHGVSAEIIQKNFKAIFNSILDDYGKNLPSIASFYNVDVPALKRIWWRFQELMRKDKNLQQLMHANKEMYAEMRKLAKQLLNTNTDELIIMKIARGINGQKKGS
jgi:hypothetical protein